MIVNLKRCLSILLAVMLLIGIIPTAHAVESGADSTQPGKTVSEGTEPTDSIDPTEPTEPTEPPDIANQQDDYAVMSVGSTQKSIMLFDYVHTMEETLDGMSHRMQQWDEEMIRQLVHTVKVISADHIKVFLYDGMEIDQTVGHGNSTID